MVALRWLALPIVLAVAGALIVAAAVYRAFEFAAEALAR